MKTGVLDTSALLALLWQEPGWQEVSAALDDATCLMSAVNVAELAAKAQERRAIGEKDIRALLAELPLEIVPLDGEQAIAVGLLRSATRHLGLSLGDRACLVLARREKSTVFTADRPWLDLSASLGLDIRCIRPDAH
ncbi:MAG: type II toxin-antitoxin system VapC family toxin [Rhodocyclaceae bacterium]|nr:type II toxin-antitoxin system VapC family toxin [Rhodocyclaceae bacterium]